MLVDVQFSFFFRVIRSVVVDMSVTMMAIAADAICVKTINVYLRVNNVVSELHAIQCLIIVLFANVQKAI